MAMPATEFREWQAYFSIYPFTQEREDWRTAKILSAIATAVSGTVVEPGIFIPDYLAVRTANLRRKETDLSLEEQTQADVAFGNQLRAVKAKRKHGSRKISIAS